MMHKHRRFGIGPVDTPEELAEKLTGHTWTGCTGFYLAGHPQYVFLNDSTCEDAVQEYAVIKMNREGTNMRQIESITFGWCSSIQAENIIREVLAGGYDEGPWGGAVIVKTEPAKSHHCGLCA
jgi:hypothetical protein